MKQIYLLFAIYILALAVYPCADQTCNDDKPSDLVSVDASNPEHDTEEDVCSPLCICACCSAQVQLSSLSTSLSFSHWAPNTLVLTAYQENFYLASSHSIWQPPKA